MGDCTREKTRTYIRIRNKKIARKGDNTQTLIVQHILKIN